MEENNNQQKESVKLMKMSKGYQWEIKVHIEDREDLRGTEEALKKIEDIDKELREKYGDDSKQKEEDNKK